MPDEDSKKKKQASLADFLAFGKSDDSKKEKKPKKTDKTDP